MRAKKPGRFAVSGLSIRLKNIILAHQRVVDTTVERNFEHEPVQAVLKVEVLPPEERVTERIRKPCRLARKTSPDRTWIFFA